MDARDARARSRSRMMHGGWAGAVPLEAPARAGLERFLDTLIPPEDGWPSAAVLRVAETVERYLVPDDEPLSLYPHLRRADFVALMTALGADLEGRDLHERVEVLTAFEAEDPTRFALLRDFGYFAYYGSPTVVEEVRARTRFGAEFHGATQPAGYDARLESWGDRPLTARGVFIPTIAVTRTRSNQGGSVVR